MKFSCSECGIDIPEGADARFLFLVPGGLLRKVVTDLYDEHQTLNALTALPRFIVCSEHSCGIAMSTIPKGSLFGVTLPVGFCRDSLTSDHSLSQAMNWVLERDLRGEYRNCLRVSRIIAAAWSAEES
jgi:hypothetical protein